MVKPTKTINYWLTALVFKNVVLPILSIHRSNINRFFIHFIALIDCLLPAQESIINNRMFSEAGVEGGIVL